MARCRTLFSASFVPYNEIFRPVNEYELMATSFDAELIVVGGGLAGTEAAWQAAERGIRTALYEMRPVRMTPAHQTHNLAELVCSNSLGSDLPDRAPGLLKNELRRLNSLLMRAARTRPPYPPEARWPWIGSASPRK